MKYFILVALLSVLIFHTTAAIPINSASSESSESSESNSSSNESSNESVYVIKEVSYEVGLIGTLNQGNSTKLVVVTPEDRIETDDIVLLTSPNGHAEENDNSTNALPTEPAVPTTEAAAAQAGPEEVNKDAVSPSEVHAKSPPSLNAAEQVDERTTSMTNNEVRK